MPPREALAKELLDLRRKHADAFAREKEIKKLLIADANGSNFQVTIKGLGIVKVSAARDKQCTGQAPELVIQAFLALPETQRDKLKDKGVVRIVEQWKGAYYGSVTPELFS